MEARDDALDEFVPDGADRFALGSSQEYSEVKRHRRQVSQTVPSDEFRYGSRYSAHYIAGHFKADPFDLGNADHDGKIRGHNMAPSDAR